MFKRKDPILGFALSFVGGVLVGGIAALLLTPVTGRRMQKKVADVADKVIDKVEDFQTSIRRMANG